MDVLNTNQRRTGNTRYRLQEATTGKLFWKKTVQLLVLQVEYEATTIQHMSNHVESERVLLWRDATLADMIPNIVESKP